MFKIEPQAATNLLDHFKLGTAIKGLFTPLVGAPSGSKKAHKGIGANKNMVGCHIKLNGKGVQWLGGGVSMPLHL